MNSYAIFFDYDNKTYRLPTNPEQVEISSPLAVEKYEVLKSGQVAIPTRLELREYSFECEFPHKILHYVETPGGFRNADYYLNLFQKWREDLTPVRFIATNNGISDEINTLVLIEDLGITERAGEEGDKYVSFKLVEYKEYGVGRDLDITKTATSVTATVSKVTDSAAVNPKATGTYTVVSGDSLWKIAKAHYGDGSKYTKIFNANKDKIKNPSLIFPGQVLTIPV